MQRANVISGVILFVTGVFMLLFVIPAQIEQGPDGMMSPRLVPQLMVGLIMGLSVLLVGSNLRGSREADIETPFSRSELIAFAAIMALFAVSIALFLSFGVLPAVIVLIVGALLILGERRPLVLVLMPLCLIVGAYLLFYRVLGTVII